MTQTTGTVGIVTVVHGRHRHLRRQLASSARLRRTTALHHVVVAMGDEAISALVAGNDAWDAGRRTEVVDVDVPDDGELPLAASRNAGAAAALAAGADLLVFLDVDCLAGPDLVADYLAAMAKNAAAQQDRPTGPLLWCGQVGYLPALPADVTDYPLDALDEWASPHPARPVPPPGTTQFSRDVRLFWSLNFAVTADDWSRIGGFHTGYRGYGGEDTDLAVGVAALDGGLGWVGGAQAFHQHHPTSSPPWQHLHAVVRNATLFHQRWGWYPMQGWLAAFADAGVIDFRAEQGVLRVTGRPPPQ